MATATGRFLSLLAIGLGVVLLLRGASVGGLWLMLLGWFGLGAARNQTQLLALQSVLRQLKVKDAAQRRFRVLEADANLKQLSRLRLSDGEGLADWLLVTRQGRWLGLEPARRHGRSRARIFGQLLHFFKKAQPKNRREHSTGNGWCARWRIPRIGVNLDEPVHH